MSTIVLFAQAVNDVVGSDQAGSPLRGFVVIGGVLAAVAAFAVISVLGRVVAATLAAVSGLFAVMGRAAAVGVLGLVVAGFMVFGGSGGGDSPATVPAVPGPVQQVPDPAVNPPPRAVQSPPATGPRTPH